MTLLWQSLPADDRGLAYGDGCFETVRLVADSAPLWPRHRARMLAGAERLGIATSADALDQALREALVQHARQLQQGGSPHAVFKLILTRGSGGRGYAWPTPATPRLLASLHALPLRPASEYREGLRIGLCQQRLALQPAFAGLKHLNRLEQVMARGEVQRAGWQEGLMCDMQGLPIELTSMNLFARFGERLWTPDLAQCGVAGVARSVIIEKLAVDQGLDVDIHARPLSQLESADEVFACNSVAGILPVRTLMDRSWPVGDLTLALQARLEQLFE
ncbi:aminodeoxychorismate lyase [Alcanivorax sp. JB21]|uniref:aminodeoxychorismate lyase n=1 Tax=Alcanivorax limicola TaxID=2874102 RepID=UPI001CBFA5FA|nr:aminodeoxychorismate lyase [Alcanivorax limicola]MBZ2187722.1 aminodeoxychorismate lyase [Alcanivorax limicola]